MVQSSTTFAAKLFGAHILMLGRASDVRFAGRVTYLTIVRASSVAKRQRG